MSVKISIGFTRDEVKPRFYGENVALFHAESVLECRIARRGKMLVVFLWIRNRVRESDKVGERNRFRLAQVGVRWTARLNHPSLDARFGFFGEEDRADDALCGEDGRTKKMRAVFTELKGSSTACPI